MKNNKKQLFFALVFVLAGGFKMMAQNALVGTWVRDKDFLQAPTVVIFYADNTCEISSGSIMVRGTYKLEGSTLKMVDTAGDFADTKSGEGMYNFTIVGESMTFTPMGDMATQRKDILASSGFKKN
ncbi:MAG: hypothetical protein RL757_1365 [Bacteroidota bacterium]|jgi:hypothetical protein